MTIYQEAARGLVDPATVMSPAFRAREMRVPRHNSGPDEPLNIVDPDIVTFALKFTKELKRRNMPFFISEIFRGKDRQNALHKAGNSKARWGSSPHNFGMAVDIVHFGRYWNLTKPEWEIIGLIGKESARKANLKVTWGGDWNFWDPAHWELSDWKVRASVLPEPKAAVPYSDMTFKEAFASARLNGLPTFMWQGKSYSTALK